MSTGADTLRTWAGHEVVADRRGRAAIGVVAFAVATALGAQVAVPLPWTPVPMTLQPLLVILAGAVLGPWLGATSMATYLAVGAMGAPIFAAGGAGLPWLLGPTGGYLVAMPAAAFLVGVVAGGDAGVPRLLAGLTLGIVALYLGGLAQLLLLTGQDLGTLVAVGVLPFVLGDLTKILLAVVLARMIQPTSLGRG